MPDRLEQAVEYFSRPEFRRLFQGMAQRYRSLGRIGGNVVLTDLTPDEEKAIAGVLGEKLQGRTKISVSLAQFQEALGNTRFAGTDLVDLLSATLGQDLVPKKEERQAFQQARAQFFQSLREEHPNNLCRQWLNHIDTNGAGTRAINQAYAQGAKSLRVQLDNVLIALTKLPGGSKYRRLPMWAAQITGSPHGFDPGSEQGNYLLAALQFARHQAQGREIKSSLSGEDVWELLDHFGIVRDDIQNFVTCIGLMANNPLWEGAKQTKSVLNLPVRELARVDNIYPLQTINTVFVVENSGVFSSLVDRFQFSPPLVCTHGQFRLATYMLLGKLIDSGAELWYSGDFDPEGLLMAQRLQDRYPGRVKPWRYTLEDYNSCISPTLISDRRLKQLDGIHSSELKEVTGMMKKTARAGYQENLVPSLLADIMDVVEIDHIV